ncbi:unnamed protein product [Effrenium voratum]|uniref:Uncharacterized protein n=1 Tax=Effrenium voratum TaxID=2562239 RepID=A0AA36NEK8_9DINO|nr:unnamed protein product [Effrenium voratum]
MPDQETPSNEYLSQLLEMVEEDDLVACHLDEVISKAESSTLQLQTSLDQAGRKLPQTTEELRRKLRIEANAWMMMASKMKNKPYLQNLELQHFDRLQDAYKKQLSLGVTLKQVCADAELKDPPEEDLHFSLVQSGCAGPPLQAAWAGRKDEFIDGFGECSPGRWHPAARGLRKTAVQRAFVQRLRGILDEFCLNNLPDVARSTFMLATGKIQQSPFSDSAIANLRSKWFSLLPNSSLAAEIPEFQPFYLHALSQTMEMLGDPDFAILDRESDGNFAEGVPVGHREPLSHVCQVFRKRRKDQKYDETELQLDMMNFQTDSDAEKALQQQFAEEEAFWDVWLYTSLSGIGFLVCLIMAGVPFAYHNFRGGLQLDFVGYWLDYTRFSLGIAERRVRWILDFVASLERDGSLVEVRRYQEFHGRLGFMSQVLPWIRPFLAPGYAWLAKAKPGAVMKVPDAVSFCNAFIRDKLMAGVRLTPCHPREWICGELFRCDAKCAEQEVVLGGWLCLSQMDPAKPLVQLEVVAEGRSLALPVGHQVGRALRQSF